MFIKAPGKTDSRQRIKASYDGFRETVYERSPLKLHTSRGSATRLVTHSHTRAPSLIYFFPGKELATSQAGMPLRSFMEIGTALSFLILWLARRRFGLRAGLIALLVIITTTAVGCSSGSTPATVKNAQEVGTRTILVNATCGNVTRSAPLVVTIQ